MRGWILLVSLYMFINNGLCVSRNLTINVSSNTPIECPSVCHCYWMISRDFVTDCSFSKLTVVPAGISRRTSRLYLNNNDLGKLDNMTLPFTELPYLDYLDLSHNMIHRLGNQTFIGLKNLQFLSVAFNNLEVRSSNIENGTFKPLVALQELHIQANCPNVGEICTYHDSQIGDLTSLRRITLDGLYQQVLDRGFLNLRELRRVEFYYRDSMLDEITPGTFVNLVNSKLETLIMNGTNLHRVLPGTFTMLKHLNTLIITENLQLCNSGMKNISDSLNTTKIKKLELTRTCKHDQDLPGDTFEALRNTSLLYLDISRNKIRNISANFILNLPKSLKVLMIQYNRISDSILWFSVFYNFMPSLEYLDASGQNFYYLELNNIERVNTTNTQQEGSVRQLPRLTTHYLGLNAQSNQTLNNSKENIMPTPNKSDIASRRITLPWPNPVPFPPKLKLLNMSYIGGFFTESAFNVSENNSLETLDVSNGKMRKMKGMVRGLHRLMNLNLSRNAITFIHPLTFGDCRALYHLDLSTNGFGKYITDSASDMFHQLKNLTILNLSDTGLKRLPNKIFANNSRLKVLKLTNNGLETITFQLDVLEGLKLLDLSYNNIVFIEPETARQLTSLSVSHVIRIRLLGNSLKCTCDYKSFVDWLSHLNDHVILKSGKHSLTCTYIDGSLINVSSLQTQWPTYKIQCLTWVVMTSCTLGFFVLLIILSSVACIYKQRWKLRYLYYAGRKTINPYHPLSDDGIEPQHECYFSFDESALISITESDEHEGMTMYDFVTKTVFPYLQQQQIRVSFRGELANNLPLYQTISQEIRCSKKVVVLLSTEYCKDYWNLFEFNMAAYEGMYANREMTVIIVVGDLTPRDLAAEVKAFIAGRHVIQLKPNTDCRVMLDQLIQMISR